MKEMKRQAGVNWMCFGIFVVMLGYGVYQIDSKDTERCVFDLELSGEEMKKKAC